MSLSGTLATGTFATENLNGEEDELLEAINAVCKNEEQSYEDFLKSFQYLNKGDVVDPLTLKSNENDQYLHDMFENGTSKTEEKSPIPLSDSNNMPKEGEMEEEVTVLSMGELQFGKTTLATRVKVQIKMDNYIKDEDLHGSDDDGTEPGYFPSFPELKREQMLANDNQKLNTASCDNGASPQTGGGDRNETENCQKSGTKESGAGKCTHVSTPETADNLLLDIGLKYQQWQKYANDISSDEDEVEISRKEGDKSMLLPGEVEEAAAPSDIPLSLTRVTQLDMSIKSATIEESTVQPSEGTSEENAEASKENADFQQEDFWEDSIEQFSLDNDFDYDNVTLTPKWQGDLRPPGWPVGK